jgi:hypothetical protein
MDDCPCLLFVFANPLTGFKKDPSLRLTVNVRCEVPRQGAQIAALLHCPAASMSRPHDQTDRGHAKRESDKQYQVDPQ